MKLHILLPTATPKLMHSCKYILNMQMGTITLKVDINLPLLVLDKLSALMRLKPRVEEEERPCIKFAMNIQNQPFGQKSMTPKVTLSKNYVSERHSGFHNILKNFCKK